MSILSDLAPENSRFPTTPSPTARQPVLAWVLALLLLLGGGFWLYYITQVADKPAKEIVPDNSLGSVSEPKPQALPTPTATTADAPPVAAVGSATIRNEPQIKNSGEASPEANVFQAMQRELQSPPPEEQAKAPAAKSGAAETPKVTESKPASGSRKQVASTPSKSTSGTRKHGERDIEIINAIVK